MKNKQDSYLAGLAILAIILFSYFLVGYKATKMADEAGKNILFNFKTVNDILNGNP